jgi:REP element-mobilizing transposase RayT
MTRPLRILIPGGFYHVTCRGNDRRAIFGDDRDRSLFLEKLRGSLANYQVQEEKGSKRKRGQVLNVDI